MAAGKGNAWIREPGKGHNILMRLQFKGGALKVGGVEINRK